MKFLPILTAFFLLISLIADRKKTKKALIIAFKKMGKIAPSFLLMLIFVSIILYLLPEKTILLLLNNPQRIYSLLLALILGSVAVMPGFIAFPLSGLLLQKGVSYMILSAFSTTLMMVGIVTFPIEKKYYGTKLTILRNILGLLIAVITAFVTGFVYHEIF